MRTRSLIAVVGVTAALGAAPAASQAAAPLTSLNQLVSTVTGGVIAVPQTVLGVCPVVSSFGSGSAFDVVRRCGPATVGGVTLTCTDHQGGSSFSAIGEDG